MKSKKKKYVTTGGIEVPKMTICDRCGNDLSQGSTLIHLPFRKKSIALCMICHWGLTFGFYLDIKNILK